MAFPANGNRLRIWYGLALILGSLAAYFPLFGNGFVSLDDQAYLIDNPHIRSLDPGSLLKLFTLFHQSNWHPLTWLSHAIDYHLWGLNPAIHHGINLLLHILNAFLVMRLGERLLRLMGQTEPLLAAGFGALLFALHPQHVESVAWLSERKDLLCALFFLLSLLSYLDYGESGGRRHYYRSLGYFLLAMLSKPMAVSLPLVLLVLDYYPLRRLNRIADLFRLAWEKAVLFALTLALALLTLLAQKGAVAYIDIDLISRVINATYSLVAYPWKWIQPIRLSPFYPFPAWVLVRDPLLWLPIGVVGMVLVHSIWRATTADDRRWLAFLLYYLITLAPTIGIVKVGGQAFADRYTYLPMIGFYLLAGQAFHRLWSALAGKFIAVVAGGTLCLLLIALTWQQTLVWRDDKSLWFTVDYFYPGEVDIANINLGNVLMKEGRLQEALPYYQKADNPRSPFRLKSLLNQGVAWERLGRPDQAFMFYQRARELFPTTATVYVYSANLAHQQGDKQAAQTYYQQALRLDPNQPEARAGLSNTDPAASALP